MSKNKVGKKYKRVLKKTHIFSSIIVLLILLILVVIDRISSGIIIYFICTIFGYEITYFIRELKDIIINYYIIFIIIIEFIVWIIVENKNIKKLTSTIEEMELFFEGNEENIKLDKDFQELEFNLNKLRQESIRNAEKAKIEVQRKNDLITYLAHDIRTPLASVIGYLSLLDEAFDLPVEQRKKYTHITLEKANRLEMLINEFFDITRFNLSSIPLEKGKINLNFMLAQLADEFYPLLSKGGRSIELELQENISIFADGDKLARVFGNLLKNAISYSYENSVIKIKAKQDKEKTTIKFINIGKVIPEQKLNNIFEKFFRLDSSRGTNTGGAGLGLAIAKNIVIQHGGNILAESNEKETTFTVTIPNYKVEE